MQLDDLKEAWAAHGAALERSLAIDERLPREMLVRKVRFALAPFVLGRVCEVALGVVALLVVVPVVLAHLADPRYLVVGGALALYAVVFTAFSGYLLVSTLQLDHSRPVTALQRELEHLRLAEYRASKWTLLGGVVLWLPALLVVFEAVTGLAPLAHVELAFLALNLIVGLLVLALGQALSARYVERSELSPRARRIVDALASRSLHVATAHLDELATFEREERP